MCNFDTFLEERKKEGKKNKQKCTSVSVSIAQAQVAEHVAHHNGAGDKIAVVCAHSTSAKGTETGFECGTENRMCFPKADLVVSELLDTVLIGEGLIPSINHCRANLAADASGGGATFIPAAATVFVQLLHAPFAQDMARLDWSRLGAPLGPEFSSCCKE